MTPAIKPQPKISWASYRIAELPRNREVIVVVCATLLLFLANLIRACTRPFMFDELFTVMVSRIPSLSDMVKATPADGQPILQYLVTRFSLRVFGATEWAARLPELLAFTAASLGIYAIGRRRSAAVFALLGVGLFWSATRSDAAHTARPYGLLVAFTALAFYSWQTAAQERNGRRGVALAGIAIGVAGAILSHFYGIFHVGIPLALGESVRLMRRRRPDFPMYAAIAAGCLAVFPVAPVALESSRQLRLQTIHALQSFQNAPRPMHLLTGYAATVSPLAVALFVLLCAAGTLLALRSHSGPVAPEQANAIAPHEWAAAFGLFSMTGFIWLLTVAIHGSFRSWYGMGTIMGAAILAAWLPPRIRVLSGVAAPAAACTAAVVLLWTSASLIAASLPALGKPRVDPLLSDIPGNGPIVIDSHNYFLPVWWYAPELRGRLTELADPTYYVKVRHEMVYLGEASLLADRQYLPIKTTPYAEFVGAHRAFALYCQNDSLTEWTRERLLAEGWHLRLIGGDPHMPAIPFRPQLFWAEAPERAGLH